MIPPELVRDTLGAVEAELARAIATSGQARGYRLVRLRVLLVATLSTSMPLADDPRVPLAVVVAAAEAYAVTSPLARTVRRMG